MNRPIIICTQLVKVCETSATDTDYHDVHLTYTNLDETSDGKDQAEEAHRPSSPQPVRSVTPNKTAYSRQRRAHTKTGSNDP